VGRPRGGRRTKIHALDHVKGRLCVKIFTGAQAPEIILADSLVSPITSSASLLGHKGLAGVLELEANL
jgi:hypothetical protein